MSDLDVAPQERTCGGPAEAAAEPARELLDAREVVLGGARGLAVTRTLPSRGRRMVGAWCFVDHYGPVDLDGRPGMRVPPHPHTGLQTVSWLRVGEVLHRDSLGSLQLIRPGELNLMTSGRAISHSEETPAGSPRVLHGVQLWVALPNGHRHVEPHFEHHADLPESVDDGARITVLMGELAGAASPAQTYTPLVGAEIELEADAQHELPLRPGFEYAALALNGATTVDAVRLEPGPLLYLGTGRDRLQLRADTGTPSALLLIGGEPFEEQLVMWWNFVGRSHDEIVQYREDWMAGRGFGEVTGYDGAPLAAPPMPGTPLMPRGRRR